jgi:hypothetical protein
VSSTHSGEAGPDVSAGGDLGLGRLGLRHRVVAVDVDVGPQDAIELLDARQLRGDEIDR